jgi:hypothetical protein
MLTFTGAPKQASLLRLPGSVALSGSIRESQLVVPKNIKSVGNVLKVCSAPSPGNKGPRRRMRIAGTLLLGRSIDSLVRSVA